jgi:hypothetical protein
LNGSAAAPALPVGGGRAFVCAFRVGARPQSIPVVVARVAGFRLTVRPTVFHPRYFLTSEFFAKFLAGVDLANWPVGAVGFDHGLMAHGLADYRKGLLGHRLVGRDIIRSVEEALVDLLAWHETVDLDHVGALDLDRFEFLILVIR